MAQCLTVTAGGARVAMAASAVAEVIRAPRVTRMPNGPSSLLGVTHLRGAVLPVLSLGRLLDPGSDAAGGAKHVVVLRRDPPIGLAVDTVEALRAMATDGAAPADGRLLLDRAGGAEWLDLDAALQARFAGLGGLARRAPDAAPDQAAPAAAPAAALAFLGFSLAGQDYALPLDAIAEVLPLPPAIAALPHTDRMLLGVFSHRGAVLPAIALRALLGLAERDGAAGERVVLLRVGGRRLALVVDRIDAILRAPRDRVGPAPSLFNRGAGEARIDAVLRLPDGSGLVAILAPERVLADDRVARLLAEADDAKEGVMDAAAPVAARERFVVIRLGTEAYGLPIGAVDEVVRLPETLARLPKAPPYVRGVMNLRGRVIPVIDQRRRFAVAPDAAPAAAGGGRVLVMTLGPLQLGFAVDAVSSILEVETEGLLPAPALGAESALFDRAVAVDRGGAVILLINPAALLDRAEADLLHDLTAASRTP